MAIIHNNDTEIIIRSGQKDVIRRLLKDRLFSLVKMSVKKPDKCTGRFSSSIFCGFMNNSLVRTFAIRDAGTKTVYEDCEYYLSLYYKRGTEGENKSIFDNVMVRKKAHAISCTDLTIDELISFLDDKELVLITNYMGYGNMEAIKVEDFLDDILLLREESEAKFILRDEDCDIRVYLRRADGEDPNAEHGLKIVDINSLDIGRRIVGLFRKKCKRYFYDDKFYFAEYDSRKEDIQASYFVTRFHSNDQWEADPVNIVNARISAYVLPGKCSDRDIGDMPKKKKTTDKVNDEVFVIDSIHFNSDVFYDFAEFSKFVDLYILYFSFD